MLLSAFYISGQILALSNLETWDWWL